MDKVLIYLFTMLFVHIMITGLLFLIPLLLFIISGGWPKFLYDFASLYIACAYITPTVNLI